MLGAGRRGVKMTRVRVWSVRRRGGVILVVWGMAVLAIGRTMETKAGGRSAALRAEDGKAVGVVLKTAVGGAEGRMKAGRRR